MSHELKIPQRIPSCIKYVALNIHPECNKQVNDYRGSHGKKGDINKIFADSCGGNAHFFSNGGTNSEYMPFNKVLQAVHSRKLLYFLKKSFPELSNFASQLIWNEPIWEDLKMITTSLPSYPPENRRAPNR
jgi:hypothetical protein